MRTRSFLGLASLLLLSACNGSPHAGGLDDPNHPPPAVATIRGQLKLSPDAKVPAGSLRIELTWFAAGSTQTKIIGQDVPVAATLPAGFALPLSGPPPAGAIWTAASYPSDAGGWTVWKTVAPTADQSFALAQVVAYEDRNGNGILDLVGVDATSAPDRIVAGDLGFVLYATGGYGSDAFEPSATAKDGYGFLVPSVTTSKVAYTQWYPISHDVTLLQTPPEWNLLMCTNFSPLGEYNVLGGINVGKDTLLPAPLGPVSLSFAPIAPDGLVFPPADQPLLTCSPGGTQYCIGACPAPQNQFYVCQPSDAPPSASNPGCFGGFGQYDPVCYTMPSNEPAGWPCAYTAGVDCAPDPAYSRCAGAVAPPPDAGVPGDASTGD